MGLDRNKLVYIFALVPVLKCFFLPQSTFRLSIADYLSSINLSVGSLIDNVFKGRRGHE